MDTFLLIYDETRHFFFFFFDLASRTILAASIQYCPRKRKNYTALSVLVLADGQTKKERSTSSKRQRNKATTLLHYYIYRVA